MNIELRNRQRSVPLDVPWLRRFAQVALPAVLPYSEDSGFALGKLEIVEVAIVSDRTIAQVHLQFMNLPDPTDVITFHHGEIVMSAETARRRAPEFGHSVEAEIALYTVHGLLHLNGFEDASSGGAARMRTLQHRIWRKCLESLTTPASK
jgi:probable rRNA maturation factor